MPPTLPTELVAQIIGYAVPPPHPAALQLRYDLLLACAQANSTFRAIAQEHLFTHVRLRTNKAIDSFHYAITGDLPHLGDKVVQLWVGDVDSGRVGGDRDNLAENDHLAQALALCPNVQDVTLCDLKITAADLNMFPGRPLLSLLCSARAAS